MSDAVDMTLFILHSMQNSLQVKLIFEYYLHFVSLTVNPSLRQLHKTVPVEISGIKWLISNGQIKMSQWCQTKRQLADYLIGHRASLLILSVLQQGVLHD